MSNPDPKTSDITTIQAKPLIAPSEIGRLFDEKMKELEQLLEAAEEARKQGNEEKAQDLVALLERKQMESQEREPGFSLSPSPSPLPRMSLFPVSFSSRVLIKSTTTTVMAKYENVIEFSSHMSQQFGRIHKEILQRM
jgi:hypothetical protein